MKRAADRRWLEYLIFAGFIAVLLLFGEVMALRAMGVLVLVVVSGFNYWRAGSIGYGWEGHDSSGYLTGIWARVVSVLIGLLGIVAILAAPTIGGMMS